MDVMSLTRPAHHEQAPVVDVERPERTLYRIKLLQEASPEVEDLVTVVYRAETNP